MDTSTPSRIDRIKRRQAAAASGTLKREPCEPFHRQGVTGGHSVPVPPKACAAGGQDHQVKAPGLNVTPEVQSAESALDQRPIDMAVVIDVLGAEELRADFQTYLDAIAAVHRYRQEDRDLIERYFLPAGIDLVGDPVARAQVLSRIRGWHVDLIALGWSAPGGQEHLEYKARTTFRQVVMGKVEDENGTPYPGMAARDFIESARVTSARKP